METVNMKMYELYEALLGVRDVLKKYFVNARSERLFLLHIASYPSYFWLCEAFILISSRLSVYFMYFMKMYEGGVLNGFFGIGSPITARFMKLGNGLTSYKFINFMVPCPAGVNKELKMSETDGMWSDAAFDYVRLGGVVWAFRRDLEKERRQAEFARVMRGWKRWNRAARAGIWVFVALDVAALVALMAFGGV